MPEKRVVPERDPQPSGNIVLQVPEKHIQTPAIRALVIPVLNECVGSIRRTVCVVHGANREQEPLGGIHRRKGAAQRASAHTIVTYTRLH
jgi:hypothetical protein